MADDDASVYVRLPSSGGGAGTGDMLSTNNLSDVANVATSRANLGLGSMATQAANAVAITGGTIAGVSGIALTANNLSDLASAATSRTNLGVAIGSQVQAFSATLAAVASYNTNGLITQTAANTFTGRTLTGGGGVTVSNGSGVSGNPTLSVSNLRTIWIPAASMRPSSTGGAAALALIASGANQPDISTINFTHSSTVYAQFSVGMPKSWNNGTVTAQFRWSHASTSTNFGVRWAIQAVAVSDQDAIAAAYGTAQGVSDTGGTTDTLYISSAVSAVTIAGSPATGDTVFFRVYRDTADGSDTMTVDARLSGVSLYYTVNTLDDT